MRLVSVFPLLVLYTLLTTISVGDESYSGSGRKGTTSGYRYTLTLFDNGQAELRVIRSRRSRMTAIATWRKSDDRQLILQFIDARGQPRGEPTIWQESGRSLEPVSWNTEDWSNQAPPDLRR